MKPIKTSQYKLSASLVCANMLSIEKDLNELIKGKIDYIHFDVMDGVFVPRYGLHPEILQAIRKLTDIPVDVHMMVTDPEPYIQIFADAGAQIYSVHAEGNNHLHRTVRLIKQAGMKAGVVLNPATPLNVLDYILDDIDLVMLMAINPGIVGHKLIPRVMEKISELKQKLTNYPNIEMEIDGGVSFDSAKEMVERGATMLVCGTSTIFKPPTPIDQKIADLRKLLQS